MIQQVWKCFFIGWFTPSVHVCVFYNQVFQVCTGGTFTTGSLVKFIGTYNGNTIGWFEPIIACSFIDSNLIYLRWYVGTCILLLCSTEEPCWQQLLYFFLGLREILISSGQNLIHLLTHSSLACLMSTPIKLTRARFHVKKNMTCSYSGQAEEASGRLHTLFVLYSSPLILFRMKYPNLSISLCF